ncbi:MAG TPA: hypothetical protein VKU77_15065 [Streptosporangiaceae bacterium]|nr:hypothetical protein [Streptosporangiaceae bacterium]
MTLTLTAAGVLAAATATASGASVRASAHSSVSAACATSAGPVRMGRFLGIVQIQQAKAAGCAATNPSGASNTSDRAIGQPPLLFNGGVVMGTKSTGRVVLTPIFWQPAGHPIDAGYQNIINTYLNDVAVSSHRQDNVYSMASEYPGSNGAHLAGIRFGVPIIDTGALPPSGCTVAANDTSNIYADSSGYDACVDDDQVQAEVNRVIGVQGRPADLAHIYVMYLPKHVETCFFPGSTLTNANACTINNQPSAAFCAYHSQATVGGAIYANMPFPIYNSATHFTCANNGRNGFPVLESPNGNPDADTIISTTSHEVIESITDPEGTAWFDAIGFEIGDECNFVFGPTNGVAGQLYNQIMNGHHYITQEEFSNKDFAVTGLGCKQGEKEKNRP